ncbi:MAG: toll/interleukin-1 receptor domain-containing protein [bacterium]|nr:toll/interleukin-1 receptor domain-containing protein [bacterium]
MSKPKGEALAANYIVFISHAGTDTWVARQIQKCIIQCGADTFLDVADIDVGDDFEEKILEEIARSRELLVLFTPWSLKRPYIWMEIGAVWGQRKRIAGILYGLTTRDIATIEYVPAVLKRINLIDINELDTYFEQLEKRVSAVSPER